MGLSLTFRLASAALLAVCAGAVASVYGAQRFFVLGQDSLWPKGLVAPEAQCALSAVALGLVLRVLGDRGNRVVAWVGGAAAGLIAAVATLATTKYPTHLVLGVPAWPYLGIQGAATVLGTLLARAVGPWVGRQLDDYLPRSQKVPRK